MPRGLLWRLFFDILVFFCQKVTLVPFRENLVNACVDVWTESVAHLPTHAYPITPSEVSRSMSGADSSVGGGSAATTSEKAGPAASSVPSAASPDPNKREVARPLVVCMRLFCFFRWLLLA